MALSHVWPMSVGIGTNGHLCIAGFDLVSLAAEYDTEASDCVVVNALPSRSNFAPRMPPTSHENDPEATLPPVRVCATTVPLRYGAPSCAVIDLP